ncbi:MAG: hypothetical protein A2854_01065 [Parcubacteria group bacterium RIFCSPHIGHO2_01_FULL_56_18]|nr:MAG: hypothetical protein A2854_01065 [Parcubacteria group bacterium RIFCSPHIGHO2_01_FULL_56_18]
MQIYRFKRRSRGAWRKLFRKFTEGLLKCAFLLLFPLPATSAILVFWHVVLFQNDLYLNTTEQDIALNAWIPMFGVIYGLFAAVVLSGVNKKLCDAHDAVDDNDKVRFMRICDAEVSPATHGLMSSLALAVISGFMALHYSSVWGGMIVVGTTTYLLALIFWVVVEFDDPCHGIWFIKSIQKEWLLEDPKKVSKERKIKIVEDARGTATV